MGDDNAPTKNDVERLRQGWLLVQPRVRGTLDVGFFEVPIPEPPGPKLNVGDDVREAAWRQYQDAARRYADDLREIEVDATNRLANTNTQLAASQMWIALAVAAMTLGQLAVSILNFIGGR